MSENQNLFSIGEVARALHVTRRIILNYEDCELIRPDVKDGTTGNRYYTIDTFVKMRTIRLYQALGLSLREIRDYLNDGMELEPLISLLKEKREQLDQQIIKLTERANNSGNIQITELPGQTIFRRTGSPTTIAEKTSLLRNAALEAMRLYGTDITRRMYFTEYPLTGEPTVSYCVAVLPGSTGELVEVLPPVRALSIFHHGPYEDLPRVARELVAYARERGLPLQGTMRNVFYEGPPQRKDPSKFITQVALPLREE